MKPRRSVSSLNQMLIEPSDNRKRKCLPSRAFSNPSRSDVCFFDAVVSNRTLSPMRLRAVIRSALGRGLVLGGDDEGLLTARIDNRFVRLQNNRLLTARIQQCAIWRVVLRWKN